MDKEKIGSVQILPEIVLGTFKVHLKYMLIECSDPECNRTWGINVVDNTVRVDQLLCQECAVKRLSKEM